MKPACPDHPDAQVADVKRVGVGRTWTCLHCLKELGPAPDREPEWEAMDVSPDRTYLERGTVFPDEAAQSAYPLSSHPCERCSGEGLPHLVDNLSEFYWEHQHKPPGSSVRSLCPRFNLGTRAREGTAVPRYFRRGR